MKKAPNEIYVAESLIKAPYGNEWSPTPYVTRESTKYVRAIIPELTWKDMSMIDEIIHDVRFDLRDTHVSNEDYYTEVLRRFMERWKEK